MGRDLRRIYVDKLGFLPEVFDQDKFFVRSTGKDEGAGVRNAHIRVELKENETERERDPNGYSSRMH